MKIDTLPARTCPFSECHSLTMAPSSSDSQTTAEDQPSAKRQKTTKEAIAIEITATPAVTPEGSKTNNVSNDPKEEVSMPPIPTISTVCRMRGFTDKKRASEHMRKWFREHEGMPSRVPKIPKSAYALYQSNRDTVVQDEIDAHTIPTKVVTKEDLLGARDQIDRLLREKACGPIMVRLAWHDAGTFDKNIKGEWPIAGGATASIRFEPEILHGHNAGLVNAHKLLVPIKEQFPSVSFADLYQMASARAIETAGGPNLGIVYGRVDASSPKDCAPDGNLPDAEACPAGYYGGPGGTCTTYHKTPQGHLRKVFYRMGFDDEAIVALSGAHTLGRAYKNRSGLGKDSTKFTDGSRKQSFANGENAPYHPGGSSWTPNFFVFDNSYYKVLDNKDADKDLLKLSSDRSLFADEGFRPFAERFRDSQDAFFESYAKAHKQLSEQGSKFYPKPISLDEDE